MEGQGTDSMPMMTSPAFWARWNGGVAQAEELLKRIAEGSTDLDGLADFMVTHGGMAVLRNIVLFANNGSLGGLRVTANGLEVDTYSEERSCSPSRVSVQGRRMALSRKIGTCSQALLVMGKGCGRRTML